MTSPVVAPKPCGCSRGPRMCYKAEHRGRLGSQWYCEDEATPGTLIPIERGRLLEVEHVGNVPVRPRTWCRLVECSKVIPPGDQTTYWLRDAEQRRVAGPYCSATCACLEAVMLA